MKVQIANQGFITRLYAACNEVDQPAVGKFIDKAACYTFKTLLSERTGDSHGNIIVIAGRHMIEENNGKFIVWFVNSEEAEPYSTYRSLEDAMVELSNFENLEVVKA